MCNPFDLAKVLMSAQNTKGRYSNSVHALASVASEEGVWKGLWRASGATMLRATMASGAQLATYDTAKSAAANTFKAMTDRGIASPFGFAEATLVSAAASMLAAVAYTTAAAPADFVRSRLMARTNSDRGDERLGVLGCVAKAVRTEGIFALWTGWWPSTLRLMPVVVLVFPLMERFRLILGIGAY